MRMSRVNISVPDDIITQARAAGLNVSRLATAALIEELDRRSKIEALDAYLAELERDLGSISADEQAAAAIWVDQATTPPVMARTGPRRRRSA
jgi:post-segregation antitoxin (ccd killing protein)